MTSIGNHGGYSFKYQMEAHIPYPVDEVVVDCIFDGQKGLVWGFAAPKSLLSAHLELLFGAGLEPEMVGSEAVALFHLYLRCAGEKGEGAVAILRMGGPETLMMVIQEGRMPFLRVFQGGPRERERLMESLRLYYLKRPEVPLQEILLTGRAAVEDGKLQVIAETAGVPTRLWLPFDEICKDRGRIGEDVQAGLSVALGLALVALKQPESRVDFRKEEFALRPYKELKRSLVFMTAAVLALVALFTFETFAELRQKEEAYVDLQGRITRVFRETFPDTARLLKGQELTQMQQVMAEQAERFQSLEAVTGQGSPLNVLFALTRIMQEHPGAVLEGLTLEGKKISLEGRTASFQSVDGLKGRLSSAGDFQAVKMGGAKMDNRDGVVRFQFFMEKKD
jgi:Tfp pilus assembly protein PilN